MRTEPIFGRTSFTSIPAFGREIPDTNGWNDTDDSDAAADKTAWGARDWCLAQWAPLGCAVTAWRTGVVCVLYSCFTADHEYERLESYASRHGVTASRLRG